MKLLIISCLFTSLTLPLLAVAQFKVPKKKAPVAATTSAPARGGYSSPAYRQPERQAPRLPATNNLLIITDSACTITLTGSKVYTAKLAANSRHYMKVLPSEYFVEAKPDTSLGLPVWQNQERVGDELRIVTIEFQKLQARSPDGQTTKPGPNPAKPPRYKEAMLEELSNNMVLVEGGVFQMGQPADRKSKADNQPVHAVKLTNFYISRYEITATQFRNFLIETSYKTDVERGDGGLISINNGKSWETRKELNWNYDATGKIRSEEALKEPVLFVSWNDAKAFCAWLSQKTSRVFDLPTEAQWEYAARGGAKSQSFIYSGGKPDEVAWFGVTSGKRAHPVGQKKANELGLFDMSGNAWEWCIDWYDDDYYGEVPNGIENPAGPKKSRERERVVRGGSWASDDTEIRLLNRHKANAGKGFHSVGFRVVTTTP